MSSLMRREPYNGMVSLQQAMDRLFQDSFVRSSLAQDVNLALDMYETDQAVVVKLAVSGLKPEDIQVTVVGDALTIKGEVKSEEQTEERNYHLRERRYGKFVRTVTLPVPIQVDATTAEFEHGVLTLTAPKREEVKPQTVEIKAKQAGS
jgi:HSP20 family protein